MNKNIQKQEQYEWRWEEKGDVKLGERGEEKRNVEIMWLSFFINITVNNNRTGFVCVYACMYVCHGVVVLLLCRVLLYFW